MGTEGTANNIVVYTQVKKADTLYKLVTSSMAENKAIGQQVLLLLLFLFSSTKFPCPGLLLIVVVVVGCLL